MKGHILKKFSIIFLSVFICISPVNVLSAEPEDLSIYTEDIKSCAVFDCSDMEIIYSKNIKKKISVASITKLVTAKVALDNISPDAVFTVGDEIDLIKPLSSVCLIEKGYRLKLSQLTAGMLMASGNDAAYTVAVNTARRISDSKDMTDEEAVEYFVSLMNAYCRNLGLQNTSFANPEGWDHENNYSTAEELIAIVLDALTNPIIKDIVSDSRRHCYFPSGQSINWTNTDRMIDEYDKYYYKYADGVKTGTTDDAGKCLVSSAEKCGRKIIIIAMGCKSEDDRYAQVRKMYESIFSYYCTGDTDGSGSTDAADARKVLRCSVGLETADRYTEETGDMDADGTLTAADARAVLRKSVGL